MIYWDEYKKYRNKEASEMTSGMNSEVDSEIGSEMSSGSPSEEYNYSYNRNLEIVEAPVTYSRKARRSSDASSGKRKSTPGFVTKKAFVIGLICSMLATSGLTIGGLSLAGAFDRTVVGSTNTISATNYNLAEYTGAKKSVEEIIAMNENAVVEITTETVVSDFWLSNYVASGAGSGVIVDSSGYILTCNHVIEDAKSVSVTTKDGTSYKAQVVGGDALTDIAVLKIEGSGFVAAQYGDSSQLSVGDLAVAIGNPLGKLGGSASVGIISSLNRDLVIDGKSMNLMQTDASINPGNSGGGLFDGEGNLIGIVVAKSIGSDVEGIGFAIPINHAAEIAKLLINDGEVTGRPMIGISVIEAATVAQARQYGFSAPGLYIYEATGQEAIDAGFQQGDLIQSVNGTEILSRVDLTKALNVYSPGDTITITVVRGDETIDIETVLIEAE